MNISKDEAFGAVVVCGVAVWMLYVLFLIVSFLSAITECRSRGWRDVELDALGRQYCVSRINQTDVIVPLKQLRKTAK